MCLMYQVQTLNNHQSLTYSKGKFQKNILQDYNNLPIITLSFLKGNGSCEKQSKNNLPFDS